MSRHENDREPAPPGFSLYKSTRLGRADFVQLYLPAAFKQALDQQKEQEEQRRFAESMIGRERAEAASQAKPSGPAAASTSYSSDPPALRPLVAGEDYDPRLQHPVYAPQAPNELFHRASLVSADKDLRRRDEALARTLSSAGILRRIALPEDTIAALSALRRSLPHFGEVIDLVRDQLLLADRTNRGPRIPPILLNSEPGLGKTHFATELAKALETTARRVSFDSAITGPTLTGSERRWGNTGYGVLFELVCLGRHANPVVILDEIDKTETQREWNPLAPLHSLLEPSTASQVRDISLDFEFDVSQVTWIATTNDVSRLLPSLLSRFRVFHIQRPDAADAILAAEAVIARAVEEMALIDFELPGRNVVVALAHLSAREIRQTIERAIAHAVAHGRSRVTPDDLPAELRDGNAGSNLSAKKNWLH